MKPNMKASTAFRRALTLLAVGCSIAVGCQLSSARAQSTRLPQPADTVIKERNVDVTSVSPVLSKAQFAVLNRLLGSHRTINVCMAALTQAKDPISVKGIVLPLPDGGKVTFRRTAPVLALEEGFTWRGEVTQTGEPSVLMLWKDGSVTGYFAYVGRIYSVERLGDGLHTVAEMKPLPAHAPTPADRADRTAHDAIVGKFGARPKTRVHGPPVPDVAPFPDAERLALEAKPVTIDVMLLFTRHVAARYIGDLRARLPFVVDFSNQTFRNSGLGNITLRLVHSEQIDLDESGKDHFDLVYGMVDGVGPFGSLHKLRNDKRADIVGLIVDNPTGCGLSTRVGAEADEAFFVVHHSCSVLTYSVAHEIGHIMGARHDRNVDPLNAPNPYAHAHIEPTAEWRTIMGYNEGCGGCRRIPYWSNPRILYKGLPTGTVANDNARVLLEQAERVSHFR